LVTKKEKTKSPGESSALQPPIVFKFFDEEDNVIFDDEDSRANNRKRKSRSAQIASQKKTSIRMLNEMLHHLDFIDQYNRKSKSTQDVEQERHQMAEKDDKNDMIRKDNADIDDKLKKKNSKPHARQVKGGRHKALANNKLPIKFKPRGEMLTPAVQIQNYKALQKRFSSFQPLLAKGDIEETKEEIRSILDRNNTANEFFNDNEIISEEKNLARCIRGYSSKADQEKIEKRNYEEHQKLRQREFQYYRQRRQKKSPQEIEWKDIFARSINFVGHGGSIPKQNEVCKFKSNCSICAPILHDKFSDRTIFFPSFRRIKDDTYITTDIEPEDEPIVIGILNSVHPLKDQKIISTLKLLELYHTLNFIQNYNTGMIVSKKK